jgi:hypothetical protein
MPRVLYEPTIPLFERAKIFRALDLMATVIDPRVHTRFVNTPTYVLQTVLQILCYMFTCGLFNDTVSSSGYVKSNDGQSANNWEGC